VPTAERSKDGDAAATAARATSASMASPTTTAEAPAARKGASEAGLRHSTLQVVCGVRGVMRRAKRRQGNARDVAALGGEDRYKLQAKRCANRSDGTGANRKP
jgi:hypothetical protein